MSTCNFLKGGAVPLIPPELFHREWKWKVGSQTLFADREMNRVPAAGYEFKRSQTEEERTEPTEFAESNASSPASVRGKVVVVYPQDEFPNVGANLGGVDNGAHAILRRVREDALGELANSESSALRRFVEFGGGDNCQVDDGTEYLWVDALIVPVVIPFLTACREEENRAASYRAQVHPRNASVRCQFRPTTRAERS